MQALDAGQSDEYSERAIVLAGVSHRVEVRTQNKGFRTRAIRLVTGNEVANAVLADIHSSRARPGSDGLVRLSHRA